MKWRHPSAFRFGPRAITLVIVSNSFKPYAVIFVGVLAVAFAAIFIRLAGNGGAPSLVIAAYRLGLASFILAPLAAWKSGAEIKQLTQRQWTLAIGAGAFLALHFATWITSLQYTTVASSVAIVASAPIWVALASFVFLRETISPLLVVGILLAVLGSALIGSGDAASGTHVLGDGLALVGAWGGAGYYVIGGKLRARLSLLAYVSVVYSVAAALLVLLALITRQPLGGYSLQTYTLFVLLAIGPQIIGHSSFNYALRYFSATFVTVAILGEPIGSTILAMLILNEFPATIVVLGGTLILIGIVVASRGETRLGVTTQPPNP